LYCVPFPRLLPARTPQLQGALGEHVHPGIQSHERLPPRFRVRTKLAMFIPKSPQVYIACSTPYRRQHESWRENRFRMGLHPCTVWISTISTQPHYKLCILVSWEVTHIFSVVNHSQDFDQLFQGFDRLTA